MMDFIAFNSESPITIHQSQPNCSKNVKAIIRKFGNGHFYYGYICEIHLKIEHCGRKSGRNTFNEAILSD
jgi:hypothetical protein